MWSSARPAGEITDAPDCPAARRRAFIARSCGLVLLCLAVGSGALASSRAAQVHSAASVPDLSGLWKNKADSVSPPWRLEASNGLDNLDAGWRGNQADGHPDLRGS